jgi:hypothetical protein
MHKRNVWTVPLRGVASPTRFSKSNVALQPRGSGRYIAREEPPGQDPTTINMADISSGKISHIVDNGTTDGNAVVGADFVAYWVARPLGETVMLATIGDQPASLPLPGVSSVRARIAADEIASPTPSFGPPAQR